MVNMNIRTVMFREKNKSFGKGKHISASDIKKIEIIAIQALKNTSGTIGVGGIGKEIAVDLENCFAQFKKMLFKSDINLEHFLNYSTNNLMLALIAKIINPESVRWMAKNP
ncbi:hypothetical protein LCGC14_0495040 [marine sediment metagenome]|uniref:Uncharacterized protein n=1 Tax=marine sediment metagenome TaxID=412755 RepID=A0A0F9SNX0_9ZZZZ